MWLAKKPTACPQQRACQQFGHLHATNGQLILADLEREQMGLKREEQKLIREIKAAAAKNNTPTVRVLAKSLVRLRGQQARLQASAAQMRGISSSMVVGHLEAFPCIACVVLFVSTCTHLLVQSCSTISSLLSNGAG